VSEVALNPPELDKSPNRMKGERNKTMELTQELGFVDRRRRKPNLLPAL